MQLTTDVHIVAGGIKGLGITDALDCHVYLLDGGSELALIDTGAGRDVDGLLHHVRAAGLDPQAVQTVLLTHAHADHAGGAARLRDALHARVCLSEAEAAFLERADEHELGLAFARKCGTYPADYTLPPCAVDVCLGDGDAIDVGSLKVRAVAVRGHSSGSICYMVEGVEGRYLFSGDTVFCDGHISLLNCAGSSLTEYRDDIDKLSGLHVDALLPGHGAFCLGGGQGHIDKACEALATNLFPPPNLG